MLIDEVLPDYDFAEVHVKSVSAEPTDVSQALTRLTPAEIPFFRVLLTLRLLPSRLFGSTTPHLSANQPVIKQAIQSGFVLLAEDPDRELVLGTIGQFWNPRSRPLSVANQREFLAFDRPGYAKAVMNFHLIGTDPSGPTTVRTETRISVSDRGARRRFAIYWLVVRWGSGLIRRQWLTALKRRAERN